MKNAPDESQARFLLALRLIADAAAIKKAPLRTLSMQRI
jgi:hypothetical protein